MKVLTRVVYTETHVVNVNVDVPDECETDEAAAEYLRQKFADVSTRGPIAAKLLNSLQSRGYRNIDGLEEVCVIDDKGSTHYVYAN